MCCRCKFFWGLDKKLKRNTTNLCYTRMKTYSPERGVNVKAILSASMEKRITYKERNQKIENCLRTILNYWLTYQCSASPWFFMLMMWRQCREKSHFSFWFLLYFMRIPNKQQNWLHYPPSHFPLDLWKYWLITRMWKDTKQKRKRKRMDNPQFGKFIPGHWAVTW